MQPLPDQAPAQDAAPGPAIRDLRAVLDEVGASTRCSATSPTQTSISTR
jgi:hypothetical protein